MEFTLILKYLGDFGMFQKIIFVLSCIIQLFAGAHMLANVFLMGKLQHRCNISNCDNVSSQYNENFIHFTIPNITDEFGQLSLSPCSSFGTIKGENSCEESSFNRSIIVGCNSYIWDRSEFESTTLSEFNIVCDKSWDVAFSSSFFMIGVLVGSAVFGVISDRFGRKTVIMLASILLLCSSIGTSFSTSFEMFSILRFLTAASILGIVQAGFILALEFIGTSKRLVCSIFIQVMSSFGQLFLSLSAYNLRNWRTLELSISIPSVILLLYYWLLPESIRWLISKGKHKEAKQTILTAAKWNKVEIPESFLIPDKLATVNDKNMELEKVGLLSLIRTPRLRKWTLNVFLNWTVITMVYYGLALSAGHLYGDIYTNFSILAMVEIPSCLLSTFALVRFGPRRVLCSAMVSASLACGATIFVPADMPWISLMFAVIARCFITVSFSIIYVYSAEIFPTVIRSTGIGLSSTFGRIGSIIAPIIIQLGEVYHSLPMIIFGSTTIVTGLLVLVLPETHKQQLPDTVEEAENFGLSKTPQHGSPGERQSLNKSDICSYSEEEEIMIINK